MHYRKRKGLTMSDYQYGGAIDRRMQRLQERAARLEDRGRTGSARYQRIQDRIADIESGGRGQTQFGNIFHGIGQGVKGVADWNLSLIGANDLIQDSFVDKSKFLSGVSNTLGQIAPMALNLVAPGLGTATRFVGQGLNSLGQQQTNVGNMGGIGMASGQLPYGMGFGTQFQNAGQMPPLFNAVFGQGLSVPGFAGGNFQVPQFGGQQGGFSNPFSSLQSLMSMFGSLGNLQKGGGIRRYQQGGLVDIQGEKGELIFHPTKYLTPVHANRTHKAMERSGDEDKVTDHPLEGSFIFSDYLKINKRDADDMVVGIKRHPYKEGKKGKEPEVFTVGDLFGKREKGKTPAKLANRLSKIFKVTGDKNDLFNVLGDQLNLQNRLPYIEGIATLSEIERERSDMEDAIKDMEETAGLRKGGRTKRRTHYQFGGVSYDAFANMGNNIQNAYDNPLWGDLPVDYGRPIIPVPQTLPGVNFGSLFGHPYDLPTSNLGNFPGYAQSVAPLDTINFDQVTSMNPNTYAPPQISSSFDTRLSDITAGLNSLAGQTQFVNTGDQQLQNLGRSLMPIGGGITTAANSLGALGSYMLYNNLVKENKDFFEGQRGLAGQARDIASFGNLFDVGLNFLQSGPEDLPEMEATRLRNFNPQRAVNIQRQLADQSLGEINSLIRGSSNSNIRAINLGNAIAANNQAIANAQINALNQQLQIDQRLDDIDFQNRNISTGNIQRRSDFANQLIQGARPGFGAFFGNEASRPLDILGLNTAEREQDIAFRQNRLYQPVQYLSAMGNSLSNLGAGAYAMGSQYTPVQTQQNQGFNLDTIATLGNLLGNLGLFK